MKILVCGDVHWSQYSSIVRGRGEKYSKRLENLIKSVNWVEQLAWSCGCEAVINLGDFFDSTQLSAEEVSALKEVQWAPIAHVFITGNHETYYNKSTHKAQYNLKQFEDAEKSRGK